jgi:hypothetical protein
MVGYSCMATITSLCMAHCRIESWPTDFLQVKEWRPLFSGIAEAHTQSSLLLTGTRAPYRNDPCSDATIFDPPGAISACCSSL